MKGFPFCSQSKNVTFLLFHQKYVIQGNWCWLWSHYDLPYSWFFFWFFSVTFLPLSSEATLLVSDIPRIWEFSSPLRSELRRHIRQSAKEDETDSLLKREGTRQQMVATSKSATTVKQQVHSKQTYYCPSYFLVLARTHDIDRWCPLAFMVFCLLF